VTSRYPQRITLFRVLAVAAALLLTAGSGLPATPVLFVYDGEQTEPGALTSAEAVLVFDQVIRPSKPERGGHARGGYDDRSNLARASAGPSGDGSAPQAIAGADDAASIISRTAQGQSARGAQALQGYLSPAERAAFAANPSGGSRFLGQGVHRATRDALDEAFPGRFIYRTRGIDFVDTWTGGMIELTTPGQVASHMARPGYRGASYAPYWLP
jgi:hypothetical protein